MHPFCKYSGCGNDFIIMELPHAQMDFKGLSRNLCERRHGIGADGLIFLGPSSKADFKVYFFNADGSEAEMCGNGIRSAVHFFLKNKAETTATIETKERVLRANIKGNSVQVAMGEAINIDLFKEIYIDNAKISLATMNTGVPHAIFFTENLEAFDIDGFGQKVRFHPEFAPAGTNFNAVQINNEGLEIRTYERGVEGETLACGTGATAAAIAYALLYKVESPVLVKVKSGNFLTIDFQQVLGKPINLTMEGPCHEIFKGEVSIFNQFP